MPRPASRSAETRRVEAAKIGKRGTVVIPASLRKRFGMEEGTPLVAEASEDGVLLRPAVVLPIEVYTPERKAEFLLSNAVDARDYASAVSAVRKMGLDPARIPHRKFPQAR
ncbi:MAG: AbrB/MazE/SpoVT family DNA-binding domain-containing protein [Candidatus Binatia bacterium]